MARRCCAAVPPGALALLISLCNLPVAWRWPLLHQAYAEDKRHQL